MKWDIYIYNKSGIPLVIDCTQGSNAYEWEFRVRDYALLPGATARIYFRKPSGAEIYNDCEVGGNVIKVDVTTQMTAEAGKIPAQFQIVPDPGKPDHVKPFVFWINVQKSLSMNSQIESTDEFTVLDNLIAEARNTIDMAEAATDKADLAAQEANTAKGQAETAAQAANVAAQRANDAKGQAETAAEAANEAAEAANTAAQGANTAKNQAETAAEAANEAADAANAAAAGDISNKVVTFQEAAERANIESGDSLAVAFGKLAKFCADFGDAAFAGIANNLTTNKPGSVLDAQQGKVLGDEIDELNTKIAWTKLHEGVRAITDNSTPWHPTLAFASFDIVIMDVIMQNHHKMIPFYVGHVDNQTFVDSWGYRFANDDVHRMVTLSFGISGRYFSDVGAKMLYGDSYQWADCLSSIYIDAIWGLNCIN